MSTDVKLLMERLELKNNTERYNAFQELMNILYFIRGQDKAHSLSNGGSGQCQVKRYCA